MSKKGMNKLIKLYKKMKKDESDPLDVLRGKKKKKDKKDNYINDFCESDYRFPYLAISLPESHQQVESDIPENMLIGPSFVPGLVAGLEKDIFKSRLVGIPQGIDGHIIVIGGSGSGKSVSIAMPTIHNFRCAICATDMKGELSRSYLEKYRAGQDRPCLVFDPTYHDGPSYDPLDLLQQDNEIDLQTDIRDMALAFIPDSLEGKEQFWVESERAVFAAALHYGNRYGLSFSQIICKILNSTLKSLCAEMLETEDKVIKAYLGMICDLKDEQLADMDRGLRNKLIPYANPEILHAFRGRREGAKCFTWSDLDRYNIFLRIPENRIEQWSGPINLMYTQLIQYLERRPEEHSVEGSDNIQTLLMMDEFPRFGKLEKIVPAITTLWSKNVNICLMVQSIAQLDSIYGKDNRKVILDNCPYKIILGSNDADTQKYLSDLIGTKKVFQRGYGENYDDYGDSTGYSLHASESRDLIIQPHELGQLKDVLLLSPDGFFRLAKIPYDYDVSRKKDVIEVPANQITWNPEKKIIVIPRIHQEYIPEENEMKNVGAKVLTLAERINNAEERLSNSIQQDKGKQRKECEAMKKKDARRNFILGELVSKHFPEVKGIEPGTKTENEERFRFFENILDVLSSDTDLMESLKERAHQLDSE